MGLTLVWNCRVKSMQVNFAYHVCSRLVVVFWALICVGAFASDDQCCCRPNPHQHNARRKNSLYHLTTIGSSTHRVYRNLTSKTVKGCTSACLQDDSCRSFIYCKDDELCQLNSAVKLENGTRPTALQSPSRRCVYFADKTPGKWRITKTNVSYPLILLLPKHYLVCVWPTWRNSFSVEWFRSVHNSIDLSKKLLKSITVFEALLCVHST